ncbi:MAG: FAD-binding oxidoreductase [Saccharospirillaceae bacterium]|nr:FAD-binding oxidoreductase [Saccharospirillaceae bacterium]MCD8530395.1 FAD-binding oxidoreductase [Saccharospirillaceae bacterium]
MVNKQQVVIIGGGILGLAIAHYLQTSGQAQVQLFERGELGAGTTSQAAALLTRARSSDNSASMVHETHTVMRTLEQRFNMPFAQRSGCLHIAVHDDERQQQQRYAQQAQQLDVATQWLDSAAIRRLLPWLAVNADSRALYYPDDGHADPYTLAQLYARSARAAGAQIITHCAVSRLESQGGVFTGVHLASGECIRADSIVLAAGPWSAALASDYDIALAMAPVRSHYWITNHQPQVRADQPMAIIPSAKAYFRSEHSALLFGVRDSQCCVADPRALPDDIHSFHFADDANGWLALEEHWQTLQALCPLLESAQLAHYLSGVSSYTPDAKPLLGRVGENVFVATGCSGAGIAFSAGIGRLLSEQILDKPTFVAADEFSPARFAGMQPAADPLSADFRQYCAHARSGKSTG